MSATTETPETLRAEAADLESEAACYDGTSMSAVLRDNAAEVHARADELERHTAEAERDSAFRQRVETVGILQASRELESAGNAKPNDVGGEFLFREWCGNSYEWDALADVERQRWNRFAARKSNLLADALAALRRIERDAIHETMSCRDGLEDNPRCSRCIARAVLARAEGRGE